MSSGLTSVTPSVNGPTWLVIGRGALGVLVVGIERHDDAHRLGQP